MIYVGIDNGIGGAIVILNKKLEIVEKHIMPTIGSTRKEYDIVKIAKLLNRKNVKVFLEKAQPRFRDGSKQAFKTGYGFGVLQGLLTAYQIPYVIIAPQTWQKDLFAGLPNTDTKQSSILFCQRIWASEDWRPTERSTKPHDGLTDAACIAYYGVKKNV